MILLTNTGDANSRFGRRTRGRENRWRWPRLRRALSGDSGMSTAEYAIGTLSAAALASVLYLVVTSDAVTGALTSLIQRALEVDF